uniref:Uncharacterized protein n=1 Tax=Babesia bovis TaxID=5865 RepID=S6C8K1_BABBO|nr:hypothetical protein [Babesia bovis]
MLRKLERISLYDIVVLSIDNFLLASIVKATLIKFSFVIKVTQHKIFKHAIKQMKSSETNQRCLPTGKSTGFAGVASSL